MKAAVLLCVAVVALFEVRVQSAPADVDASKVVEQLKDMLSERHSHGHAAASGARAQGSVRGAVDLENDIANRQKDRSNSVRKPLHGQRSVTEDEKNKIIEYHNKLRKQEGASNMETLRWSDQLAQLAQSWADGCYWGHRPTNEYEASDYGFSSVGENIWAWSDDSQTLPDKAIQDWYDEKDYYDYNSNYCSKEPCGHYTTVTWAQTTHVGCGIIKCAHLEIENSEGYTNGMYMVCNYGPWGTGEQPFKKGNPCTECDRGQFFCTDTLCDSSCSSAGGSNQCECKATCQCGSQSNDCKCNCQKGYTGPDCSVKCEDKDSQCGANPGWPASWCTDKSIFGGMMYDQVNEKCPKMCGKCEAGDEPCQSSRNYKKDAQNFDDAELQFLIGALQGKKKP